MPKPSAALLEASRNHQANQFSKNLQIKNNDDDDDVNDMDCTKEDYDYAYKEWLSIMHRQQGFLIDSKDELRTCVEYIDDDYSNNNDTSFIGNQCQMCFFSIKWQPVIIFPYVVGSGLLINKDFLVNDIKIPIGDKHLILSCAHNMFVKEKKYGFAESAAFSHRKSITKDGSMELNVINKITGFHIYPKYMDEPSKPDPYNDLSISICEANLKKHKSLNQVCLSNVGKAKKGDTICVIGYPVEDRKIKLTEKMYFMKGTIDKIIYYSGYDEAIILYKDINATEGQDGSPVYLQQSDKSWTVIGFHLGFHIEHDSNFAVGLTDTKLSWIVNKAYHTLESPESIRMKNYFGIYNNFTLTKREFDRARTLRPYGRKNRLVPKVRRINKNAENQNEKRA